MSPWWLPILAKSDDGFVVVAIVVGITVALISSASKAAKRQKLRRRHESRTGRSVQKKVDPAAFRRFAETMGFDIMVGKGQRMQGVLEGFRVRLEYVRMGGARTRVQVPIRHRVPAKVSIRAGRTRKTSLFHRPTGDPAFDQDYRVVCFTPGVAEKVLTESARAWLKALYSAEVVMRGKLVVAYLPGFETDPDRLRGLLEAGVELSKAAGELGGRAPR